MQNQRYPEGGVSKDDDDEVDGVGQKHQHVDVSDCAVLWVDQVMEELLHGKVDLQEPAKKTTISRNTDIRLSIKIMNSNYFVAMRQMDF